MFARNILTADPSFASEMLDKARSELNRTHWFCAVRVQSTVRLVRSFLSPLNPMVLYSDLTTVVYSDPTLSTFSLCCSVLSSILSSHLRKVKSKVPQNMLFFNWVKNFPPLWNTKIRTLFKQSAHVSSQRLAFCLCKISFSIIFPSTSRSFQ